MKEWENNREIYRRLEKTDLYGVHIKQPIHGGPKMIRWQFLNTEVIAEPAKSYCVALVYAHNLARDFGGLDLDYLKREDLLLDCDFFVPYDRDPVTYKGFLLNKWWVDSPMAKLIDGYYKREMLLQLDN